MRGNKVTEKYLPNEISKWIPAPKINHYFYHYNWIRAKRFLLKTTVIFIFQYLTIINLTFSSALPMYPPMGIAFIMFYLLGNQAFFGLLLGEICAYFLKGLPFDFFFCYLTADIGCGWLGAFLCQTIFPSEMRMFSNWREWLSFIKVNAVITCLLSSFLRLTPLILTHKINSKFLLIQWLNLWLADLNSVLIMTSFLLSWWSVLFNRVKISEKEISKILVFVILGFIVLSILFVKNALLIYLIITAMVLALHLAFRHGYLIATAMLYMISTIYLTFFMIHKQILSPLFLFIFVICMFCTCFYFEKRKTITTM